MLQVVGGTMRLGAGLVGNSAEDVAGLIWKDGDVDDFWVCKDLENQGGGKAGTGIEWAQAKLKGECFGDMNKLINLFGGSICSGAPCMLFSSVWAYLDGSGKSNWTLKESIAYRK